MNIAEVIHKEIKQAPNRLNKELSESKDWIKTLQEHGVEGSAFESTILPTQYALRYPQNPFITELQVKRLCIKHGLKFGGMFAFIGEIPERNLKELHAFRDPLNYTASQNQVKAAIDIRNVIEKLRKYGGVQANIGVEDVLFEASFNIREFLPHKAVFPITEEIAIHWNYAEAEARKPKKDSCNFLGFNAHQDIFNLVILDNSTYNSIVTPISPRNIKVDQEASREGSMYSVKIQCSVSINLSEVLREANFNLVRNRCMLDKKVIAPAEEFNTTALEEHDQYRYGFSRLSFSKAGLPVDDPIILQPVKGGYLVITMWGGESDLINTNKN